MDLSGGMRVIVCLLLELFNPVNARTLKMANVLYRHGDRAPIVGFPTDQHKESAWPDGYGQLTQVGMRMEYNLGQFLRTRYVTNSTFLNSIYMHKMVHIRSSNSDRCLMSAESQLAGLYPPHGHQIWKKAFPWQPIPVHTVPSDVDPMLRPWDCVCPRLAQLQEEQKTTPEYRSVMAGFKDFFKFLGVKAGMEVTFDNVWHISDALYCEQQHDLKLPDWVSPAVVTNLTFLDIYSMKLKTGGDEFSRLTAGPLLAEMVENMKLFSSGQGQDVPVLSIYSAHDTTVVPLLGAMNVYNGKQPPYACAVLVEMYQESDGKYTVDIFYRNNSARPPYKLKIPNCADPCPLEDFFRLTKNRVSVDRTKECGTAYEEKHITMLQAAHNYLHNNIGLVVGLGIVVVLMLMILVVLIIQCRKNSEGGYSKRQIRRYNLQDTDEEESDSTVLLKG